jgi:Domain of unknown function (DUF4396)
LIVLWIDLTWAAESLDVDHVTQLIWAALAAGIGCCVLIAADIIAGRRQRMWIMNVVWPITGLWAGPLGAWAYFRYGRPPQSEQPFPVAVGKATTHCGAGCTLGDILAALLSAILPLSLFGHRIFGDWVYAFGFAYLLGVAFQYFTIKPMRDVSAGQGLLLAVKADTLSLVAWQVGMYGWMATARFALVGHELDKSTPLFWVMMQVAMCVGFATAYPVNWWLVQRGIKERM